MFSKDKLKLAITGLEKSLDYNIDNVTLRLLNEIIRIMDAKNSNLSKM